MFGILAGTLTSGVTVFMLAKFMSLSHTEYVTLLPKSITTAIGMGLSEELGGYVTITVAVATGKTAQWMIKKDEGKDHE